VASLLSSSVKNHLALPVSDSGKSRRIHMEMRGNRKVAEPSIIEPFPPCEATSPFKAGKDTCSHEPGESGR
jgi:hypothetical protein